MAITPAEIAETRGMVEEQNLDIRTITMGVSLMGCGDENLDRMCTKIYDHVTHTAEHLVETAENLEREYGIPIVNKRVSVTPVAQIAACCKDEDLTPIAHALDRAAVSLAASMMVWAAISTASMLMPARRLATLTLEQTRLVVASAWGMDWITRRSASPMPFWTSAEKPPR